MREAIAGPLSRHLDPLDRPLDVRPLLHDGGATVIARGELGLVSGRRLVVAVRDVLRCRPPRMTVDLRGVTSMDTEGAACLLSIARSAERVGCELAIVRDAPGAGAVKTSVR